MLGIMTVEIIWCSSCYLIEGDTYCSTQQIKEEPLPLGRFLLLYLTERVKSAVEADLVSNLP